MDQITSNRNGNATIQLPAEQASQGAPRAYKANIAFSLLLTIHKN